MKAVICTKYGEPGVLSLVEIDKPIPKKNEIGIKIFATAVTSSDTYIRNLNSLPFIHRFMARLVIGYSKPRNPILGMVFSGEIDSIGTNSTEFNLGDAIFGITVKNATSMNFGTYAEYICIPKDCVFTSKPSKITHETAAAIPYGFLIAMDYLKRGKLDKANKILIYGASGAVGTSAIQIARYYGKEVTGVCSTINIELVKSLGAIDVIDYTKEDFSKRKENFDLILDAVGRKKSKDNCENYKQVLSQNGKFVSVDDGSPTYSKENLDQIRMAFESGKMKAVIDKVYPLEKIVSAHKYVDTGRKKGNVIITI